MKNIQMKNNKVMKKFLIIIAALFLLSINIPTTESKVQEFQMEEEGYIDDIPFDTDKVILNYRLLNMPEERYIDDIPFDTEEVVKNIR